MSRYFLLIHVLLLILQYELIAFSPAEYSGNVKTNLLEEFRLMYYAGVENEEYIDTLQNKIKNNFGDNINEYPPIVLAYRAGVDALKSKHAFWPFNKMSYLNESMEIFEQALNKEPYNLEIRFMRFSILYYVPGILGYDDDEKEDLKIVYELLIKKNYTNLNPEIQNGMIEFLIQTKMLTKKEETELKSHLTLAKTDE